MVSLNIDTSTKDKLYFGLLINIDDTVDDETIKLYKTYSKESKFLFILLKN